MESKIALSLTQDIFSNSYGRFYIEHKVSDDDNKIRSLLTHETEHAEGLLPEHIPTPIFPPYQSCV